MKKIFIYALTLIALAACTAEDAVVEEVLEQPEDESSIMAVVEQPIVSDGLSSRAYITFDKSTPDIFSFSWESNECVGAFPYTDTRHANQIKLDMENINAGPENTNLVRKIVTPNGVSLLTANTTYVAYYPYNSANESFTSIPLSYENQTQEETINMSVYFDNFTSNPESYAAYKESEKASSAHLSQYDYLCAGQTTTRSHSGVTFFMRRAGAIGRFYIKCPQADLIYDEFLLYNSSLDFTLTGTMDASVDDIKDAITPITTSHVVKLKLGPGGNGIDYTLGTDGKPKESNIKYFDYYNGKYTPYLTTYVMFAPIDFSKTEECSTLYLIAHKNNAEKTKLYFKAVLKSTQRPNLTPNLLYRWSLTPGTDTPIEFTETTVEDWKQTEGYSNGEGGTGTSGW